jgi:hypothetical protein
MERPGRELRETHSAAQDRTRARAWYAVHGCLGSIIGTERGGAIGTHAAANLNSTPQSWRQDGGVCGLAETRSVSRSLHEHR